MKEIIRLNVLCLVVQPKYGSNKKYRVIEKDRWDLKPL